MSRVVLFLSFAFLLFSLLFLGSCRENDFETSPDFTLEFSMDSVLFDTVFTTLGSSTRRFKVYNRTEDRVKVDLIELEAGINSYYRINVDGRSGDKISGVEIGAKDSIYVFVEVTVDPVDQDLPLIIAERLVFHIPGATQNVNLVAWGQDAHFIHPNVYDSVNNISYHLIAENTSWLGPKPYVVYGLVLVAPGVTLNVEEGAKVHFHNKSALIFLSESSFKVQGSLEEPIVFQGDRLEAEFRNRPAQWGYIWLTATSKNHVIDYAIIKNGTYGIVLDSIGSFEEPTLRISNSIIKNIDQTALELNGSHVIAENLVLAYSGLHALHLQFGGNYDFRNITIANYYNEYGSFRQTPSVLMNNYFIDTSNVVQVREFEKVYFGNSIVYGGLQDEIGLDLYPDESAANFVFDHSLVATRFTQFGQLFLDCIVNESPRFVLIDDNDYRLQEDSPVIGKGNQEISSHIPYDILGNPRENGVDMGAYQYYEIEDEEEE